jgi:hypothetical protein
VLVYVLVALAVAGLGVWALVRRSSRRGTRLG